VIGDIDPEDAYDVDDPPDVRLSVLERVLLDLRRRDDDRREGRRRDALRVARNLEHTPGVDRVRLADLLDALEAL
jgi:hypothetical protein